VKDRGRRERPHAGAQLSLFEETDGWRYQLFATNSPANTGRLGQLAYLEAGHRAHVRVEDCIHNAKNTGLAHLPSKHFELNRAWCLAVAMACDLLAWLRLLCLTGELANAESETLRYRLLHTAARIIRTQYPHPRDLALGHRTARRPARRAHPCLNQPDRGAPHQTDPRNPPGPWTRRTSTTAGKPTTPPPQTQEVKITMDGPIPDPSLSAND
jgi:hypothetical protein